jgi:hypothetical protein
MTKIFNFFRKLFGMEIPSKNVLIQSQEDFTATPTIPEHLTKEYVKKKTRTKKTNQ